MFDHKHYVPVLKWRMGEYQALHRLTTTVKEAITPLLEIPPVGWDFELEQASRSIDDHLARFGQRLKAKWGTRRCFVDMGLVDGAERMADGSHPVERVFALARTNQCQAVPVSALDRDAAFQAAIAAVHAVDGRGVCLRLKVSDYDRPAIGTDIRTWAASVGVRSPADCDLVIDYASGSFESTAAYARLMDNILQSTPNLARWRSVTVSATAFPRQIPVSMRPYGTIPRSEWVGYKALVGRLPATVRVPTFGDYAVNHPATEQMDPRFIDPNAKLKYTIDDQWHIGLGRQVRAHGRGQMQQLCQDLLTLPYWAGRAYSYGDTYIDDCAAGLGAGGTSTWPCVTTNHHLTRAVDDVASFAATLGIP